MTRRRAALTLLTATAALVAAAALPGTAARATTGTGADISAPQCGSVYPAAAYGIVGVNATTFADANPCLTSELGWAQGLGQPAQAYLLAADPGPGGTFWGRGGSRPCDGSLSVGCAYDYGELGALTALDRTAPLQSAPMHYWVDVELGAGTGESWQADPALNDAEIHGELDGLASRPGQVSAAGVYTRQATPGQRSDFATLVGSAHDFVNTPFWLATGATADPGATACGSTVEAGAPITQAQSSSGATDTDVVCPPRLAKRSQTGTVATRATVSGTAEPGSALSLVATDLAHHRLAALTVVTASSGRWSTGAVPFTRDARLTVTADNGAAGIDLRPAAEVHVTGRTTAAGGCRAVVHGVTAQWWSGQTVQLRVRGHRVASAGVKRVAHGGSWSVTVAHACGSGLSVVPYVDGLAGHSRITEPSTSTRSTRVRVSA